MIRLREIEQLYRRDPAVEDVRVMLVTPLPQRIARAMEQDPLYNLFRQLKLPCIFGFEPWCEQPSPPYEEPPTEGPPVEGPPPEGLPFDSEPPTEGPERPCRTAYREPRMSWRAGVIAVTQVLPRGEVAEAIRQGRPLCYYSFGFYNLSRPGEVCRCGQCSPVEGSATIAFASASGVLYYRDIPNVGASAGEDLPLFDIAAQWRNVPTGRIYYYAGGVYRLASDRAATYLQTAAYYGRARVRQIFNVEFSWRWRGRMRQDTVRVDYVREIPFER